MPAKTSNPTALKPPSLHRGYRPETVAQYTGLATRTIYQGCHRGDIRHVRVGRAIVIPGAEVLRLIGAAP